MNEPGRRSNGIIQWLAGNVFPFEGELRARLRQSGCPLQEIDDIVQESYLQLAQLPGVEHIDDARAYLFATARSVLLNRVRHDRVVRIDQLADRDALTLVDELMRQLPIRCRQVFELRRIDGVSQRMIAEQLGISEYTVAYEASRALRLIMSALKTADGAADGAADGGSRRNLLIGGRKRGRPRK